MRLLLTPKQVPTLCQGIILSLDGDSLFHYDSKPPSISCPLPPPRPCFQDGSGDLETSLELKGALPTRQLLVSGERGTAATAPGARLDAGALAAMTAGVGACIVGVPAIHVSAYRVLWFIARTGPGKM